MSCKNYFGELFITIMSFLILLISPFVCACCIEPSNAINSAACATYVEPEFDSVRTLFQGLGYNSCFSIIIFLDIIVINSSPK